MTRFRKITIINSEEPLIKYHFRETDNRLYIDVIDGVKFKMTPASQREANKIIDELFTEVSVDE